MNLPTFKDYLVSGQNVRFVDIADSHTAYLIKKSKLR